LGQLTGALFAARRDETDIWFRRHDEYDHRIG
jgi:hypothetical protein